MFILKQLRRKKKVNQTDLAKAIGVSLRTIQLYEKKNANIPIKNLTKIATYFEKGIDELYAREVSESGTKYNRNKRASESKKGHSINKLAPGKYLLSVPLITVEDQKVYCGATSDLGFINTLARMGFVVDQVSVARYMAFEVSNNSMDNGLISGIPQKSIVLGKQVSKKELNKKIKEGAANWIIIYRGIIMCKKITEFDKKNNTIRCHSLNNSPEYPDFEVDLNEVKEFFNIIKKQVD